MKMQVHDFNNDVILATACRGDVESLCKDVKPGAWRRSWSARGGALRRLPRRDRGRGCLFGGPALTELRTRPSRARRRARRRARVPAPQPRPPDGVLPPRAAHAGVAAGGAHRAAPGPAQGLRQRAHAVLQGREDRQRPHLQVRRRRLGSGAIGRRPAAPEARGPRLPSAARRASSVCADPRLHSPHRAAPRRRCLADHLADPDLSPVCRGEVITKIQRRWGWGGGGEPGEGGVIGRGLRHAAPWHGLPPPAPGVPARRRP
jgi:hypothetical protein